MRSTITVTELETRVANFLADATKTYFTAALIHESLLHAFDEFNRATRRPGCPLRPNQKLATVKPDAGQREILLDSLTTLQDVVEVWFPWTATDSPPNVVNFRELWDGTAPGHLRLLLLCSETGDGSKDARILYRAPHTLDGLAGATFTSFDAGVESVLVLGAAAYALYSRAIYNVEDSAKGTFAAPNEGELATRLLMDFRAALGLGPYQGDSSFSMDALEPSVRRERKK